MTDSAYPPPYTPVPPVTGSAPARTTEQTLLALAAHLSWVVSLPLVVPLIVFLLKQDDPFVRGHAAEALNFHITTGIAAAVCTVLIFVLIGIPLLIVLGLFFLVFSVLAAVAAGQGRSYRYPLTLHLVH